jgi:hypothetical protein
MFMIINTAVLWEIHWDDGFKMKGIPVSFLCSLTGYDEAGRRASEKYMSGTSRTKAQKATPAP